MESDISQNIILKSLFSAFSIFEILSTVVWQNLFRKFFQQFLSCVGFYSKWFLIHLHFWRVRAMLRKGMQKFFCWNGLPSGLQKEVLTMCWNCRTFRLPISLLPFVLVDCRNDNRSNHKQDKVRVVVLEHKYKVFDRKHQRLWLWSWCRCFRFFGFTVPFRVAEMMMCLLQNRKSWNNLYRQTNVFPRPMICLNSIMEFTGRNKTMFLTSGASTPVLNFASWSEWLNAFLVVLKIS